MFDTKALFQEKFEAEVQKRLAESPSYTVDDFVATGRAPAPYGKRTRDWWMDHGHEMVDRWIEWRKANPAFVSWETPDGKPAIEIEMRFTLPGDIPILAYVDNIFVNTNSGEIVCLDKKTGRTPETAEQLGLYASGVEILWGKVYRPTWGYWWDASKGTHSNPINLDRYTPQYLANAYAEVIRGMNAQCFPARPANNCGGPTGWCGVKDYCAATGGHKAAGVDPLLLP